MDAKVLNFGNEYWPGSLLKVKNGGATASKFGMARHPALGSG